MPILLIGGAVTLAAGGTGEIKLEPPVSVNVLQISFNGTGRFEVTDIAVEGVVDYLEGVCDSGTLREHENVYVLPEAIVLEKGQKLSIKVRDLSGATNLIYALLKATKVA